MKNPSSPSVPSTLASYPAFGEGEVIRVKSTNQVMVVVCVKSHPCDPAIQIFPGTVLLDYTYGLVPETDVSEVWTDTPSIWVAESDIDRNTELHLAALAPTG